MEFVGIPIPDHYPGSGTIPDLMKDPLDHQAPRLDAYERPPQAQPGEVYVLKDSGSGLRGQVKSWIQQIDRRPISKLGEIVRNPIRPL